jgi:hypothetical protein
MDALERAEGDQAEDDENAAYDREREPCLQPAGRQRREDEMLLTCGRFDRLVKTADAFSPCAGIRFNLSG